MTSDNKPTKITFHPTGQGTSAWSEPLPSSTKGVSDDYRTAAC